MRKQQGSTGIPLNLFISYAHEDEPLLRQLEAHLSLLQRQGLIASWDDRLILAGDEQAKVIDRHLESASIILLLISADFLASDTQYQIEMQRALERHKRGETRVVPVIVRPCDWQSSPFASLQCLPRTGKPISAWDNQDEAFAAITQELRRIIEQQFSASPRSSLQLRSRERLLKRVQSTWIKGLLEKSLHQAVWIDLHLQEQPDALENPWRFQVQELNQTPRDLPIGTSIVEVYDGADGELLILGEPGSGKTTLLLQLARALLNRAESDPYHPLPVPFNLSSWAQHRHPLDQWLVSELREKYQVHPSIGKLWVDHHELLPLLDGLDEVPASDRIGCIQAITTYYQQQDQTLPSLVVCCRSHEYQELTFHLPLNQAVSILPLTDQQVEAYLSNIGKEADGLRYLLAVEPEFVSLAKTPLMLSIATLAFQGKHIVNFPSLDNFPSPDNFPASASREQLYQIVFRAYVERMLKRRSSLQRWTTDQPLQWLATIAKHMYKQHETIFSVHSPDSSWLPDLQQRQGGWAFSLISLLYVMLHIGLCSGLYFGLFAGWHAGLLTGLLTGLLSLALTYLLPNTYNNKVLGALDIMLPIIYFGSLVIYFGLLVVLAFSLLVGLVLVMSFYVSIQYAFEGSLELSLAELAKVFLPSNTKNFVALKIYMPVFLVLWLLVGLPFGLHFGVFVGVLAGLFFILFSAAFAVLPSSILFDSVSDFLLRLFLWRTNCLPWNLSRFLDEATERLFLRKVGGGYIFVHRLLLEYFATLEASSPEEVPVESNLLRKSDKKE